MSGSNMNSKRAHDTRHDDSSSDDSDTLAGNKKARFASDNEEPLISPVFHDYALDYSVAPSSVVSRITGHLMRSTSLLSDHVEEVDLPIPVQHWLDQFSNWCNEWKIKSLDVLLARCDTAHLRYAKDIIEPKFQRDFIRLLPKELALQVLSFLEPKDLLVAALTCRYWNVLCDDSLLWKEKCSKFGIFEPQLSTKRKTLGFINNPWKQAFLIKQRIKYNWRSRELKPFLVLKGHDDHVVTCLQFCGDYIVSGSDDNTLKLWCALTGKCLHTLTGHTGGVWCSQFNGEVIVSGSTDRTLRVWSISKGTCKHVLNGHTSTVRCISMHGNIVVSGSRDATLRVWDIQTGECKKTLQGHFSAVRCVQFDGKKVVSGAYDYLVKVWDPHEGTCLHTLQGHSNRVYSLQFDGTHIVSGSLDTSIRVWNAETGQCLHALMGHQSLTSGMELKQHILVSGNADSTVKVWNIVTGHCMHTLQGSNSHTSAVTSLQFTDNFIVTSSDDGTVKLWDIKTGEFIRNLVLLESKGNGGVVWRVKCNDRKLVCAVGSRNGIEDTKLFVLDFDA
ncbi:F-box/WD repeat-containing protein 7-like [Dysidea avara]|uniref:F-box/WD repeat-containing protein 7-like n=1 Tax=Dysidea avara TaxID=196820 RepID=UPI00332441E2